MSSCHYDYADRPFDPLLDLDATTTTVAVPDWEGCVVTAEQANPWWEVDLGDTYSVTKVWVRGPWSVDGAVLGPLSVLVDNLVGGAQ